MSVQKTPDENEEEEEYNQRTVTPLEAEPSEESIVACDIETYDDEQGRKQMAYGYVNNQLTGAEFTTKKSMREYLLESSALRSAWIFAHNAEFDFGILGLIDELERIENAPAREENKMGKTALVVKDGGFRFATLTRFSVDSKEHEKAKAKIEEIKNDPERTLTPEKERGLYEDARKDPRRRVFIDSLQFTLAGLEASAEMMDVETKKGDFDFSKLGPEDEMKEAGTWEEMVEYCKKDVWALRQIMSKYQDMLNDLGGKLQVTTASSSLDLFRREYLTQPYHQSEEHMELCEEARFGGLTQAMVFNGVHGNYSSDDYAGQETVMKIDINSSYPYQMTRGIPSGNQMVQKHGQYATVTNIREWDGVSKATVHVPESEEIPILPYQPADKLHFPTGTITGAWTHAELRYALERGYEIREVHEQLLATDTIDELGEFAEDLYEGRQEVRDENPALGSVMKIMMNSQYGKWCQTDIPQFEEVDPFSEAEYPEDAPVKVEHTITKTGEVIPKEMVKVDEMKVSNNHPIIGGYITAYGRLQLLKAMHATIEKGAKPLYCDTDSIVVAGLSPDEVDEIAPLGDDLGEWDIEAGPGCTAKVVVDQEFDEEKEEWVDIKEEREMAGYEISVMREKAYMERMKFEDVCPIPKTTLKGVPGEVRTQAFLHGSTGEYEKFAGHQEAKRMQDTEPLQTIEREKVIQSKSSSKRVMTDEYSRAKTAEEIHEDLDD